MRVMALTLRRGEKIPIKGRTVTVTDLAYESMPAVRAYLIGVARNGGTTTYGELKDDLELSYVPQGLGRLMDLLSVDCTRRDEPSLAALVVTGHTGEVGYDFAGDAAAERELLYNFWAATASA